MSGSEDKAFFSTLNYSSCNEDWRTERKALRIGPDYRVLCVTGSGDRPLHLLLEGAAEVIAIDANPVQNHLLELKAAAIRRLPYEQYLSFLGYSAAPSPGKRARLLDTLAPELSEPALAWWRANPGILEAGPLYQGRWERYYRQVARVARLLRGGAIRGLFACATIEEQREFVRRRWDRTWWRWVYLVLCSRTVSRILLRDPAFYAQVDPSLSVGDYIYRRMLASLDRTLARENFMLSLLFRGCLPPEDLPPYLSEEAYPRIRARLDRLRIVTAPLVAHLNGVRPGSYSRFSLSDVPSYLDPTLFEQLLESVIRAAAPGSVYCIREFLSAHAVPERFLKILGREPELEQTLEREDRAFAYRFIVGTIQGGNSSR